jgi:hypothetical protein
MHKPNDEGVKSDPRMRGPEGNTFSSSHMLVSLAPGAKTACL